MMKYHESGTVCQAKSVETCPLAVGKGEEHFNTKEEAIAYTEKKNSKIYSMFNNFTKKDDNKIKGLSPVNIFDEDTLYNYTNGDCVYFANELCEKYPEKYELLLISDFSDDDIEECFYHAVAAEINSEKLIDANEKWDDWNSLMNYLNSEDELDIEEIYGEEITVDYYLDMGGHEQTYTTPQQLEKDMNKFENFL